MDRMDTACAGCIVFPWGDNFNLLIMRLMIFFCLLVLLNAESLRAQLLKSIVSKVNTCVGRRLNINGSALVRTK